MVAHDGGWSGPITPGRTVTHGLFTKVVVVLVPLTVGGYTGKLCAAVSATRVRLLQKCAIDSTASWE